MYVRSPSTNWILLQRLPIYNHQKTFINYKKRQNKGDTSPEFLADFSLWRRPAYQTLSKTLDISSTVALVAPDLLKALTILSDTTARRSPVDQEALKPYWKSQKKPNFWMWGTSLLYKIFKDFNNQGSKNCMLGDKHAHNVHAKWFLHVQNYVDVNQSKHLK